MSELNPNPMPGVLSDFSKLMQPIFSQQDNLERQNQELTALRDWLLPMLMNGQMRVEGIYRFHFPPQPAYFPTSHDIRNQEDP